MMEGTKQNSGLSRRTVLIAPSAAPEFTVELEHRGARVISWPRPEILDPESFTSLDESIANLFGYDWLIFRTGPAVEFFLKRLQTLGHDFSELDTLRVCAIGATTAAKLEASPVHLDLITNSPRSNNVFEEIENYVGGRAALGRLNFLMPCASTMRDRLYNLLEEAEARIDLVVAYRTVSNKAALTQLTARLNGGGIDGVAFDRPSSVLNLAELLDTSELAEALAGVQVFCLDDSTASVANGFDLSSLSGAEPTTRSMTGAMAEHFRVAV